MGWMKMVQLRRWEIGFTLLHSSFNTVSDEVPYILFEHRHLVLWVSTAHWLSLLSTVSTSTHRQTDVLDWSPTTPQVTHFS